MLRPWLVPAHDLKWTVPTGVGLLLNTKAGFDPNRFREGVEPLIYSDDFGGNNWNQTLISGNRTTFNPSRLRERNEPLTKGVWKILASKSYLEGGRPRLDSYWLGKRTKPLTGVRVRGVREILSRISLLQR